MLPFDAVLIIEGDVDADDESIIEAWQSLIDSGMACKLQGSYGRGAAALIEAGTCHRRSIDGLEDL